MKSSRLLRSALFLSVVLSLFSLPAGATCNLPAGYNFNPGFRMSSPAVGMLADYGLIFDDAKWRECSVGVADANGKHGAYEALINKINATFAVGLHYDHFGAQVGPFQGAFEGGHVALIFASALMIGGHGDLDTTLDDALIRVRNSYVYRRELELRLLSAERLEGHRRHLHGRARARGHGLCVDCRV